MIPKGNGLDLKVGVSLCLSVSIINFYFVYGVVCAYSRKLHMQRKHFRCVNCICTNYSSCHGWWAAYLIGIMYFSFSVYFLSNCPQCRLFLSLTRVFYLQQVAGDALVDDHESQDLSEEEIDVHHLLRLARKLWLPAFFFLTVLSNLGDSITILFIKLTLFLLSTKPSPFSVYVFVDKVRYCINNLTL